jgi:hypothetical protein
LREWAVLVLSVYLDMRADETLVSKNFNSKLRSIQEFFFLFSGGRAGIVLTCCAFILYYTFITLFFMSKCSDYHRSLDQVHLCLDYLSDQLLMTFGYDAKNDGILMDLVLTLVISLILYPLCIIKEFHKIKNIGITICITNLLILLIVAGYLIVLGPSWYVHQEQAPPNFLKSTTIFNSAPEFCFTFHFQIYFLIVL